MNKAIVFVDANNWYHNLKSWFKPSDIDIKRIVDLISKEENLDVLEIRWYASIPNIEENKLNYLRHMNFLSSLKKRGIKITTRKLQRLSNKDLENDFVYCCNPDCEFYYQVLFEHFKCKKNEKTNQKTKRR